MARIIRRYSNRRLYDTLTKKNITLEDFLEIIRKGEEVRVIDHRTGKDITEDTVAKALILEEGRESKGFWLSFFTFMRDRGASFFRMGRYFGGFFLFLERKVSEFMGKLAMRGMISKKDEETLRNLLDGRRVDDEETKRILKRLLREAFKELGVMSENEVEKLREEVKVVKDLVEKLEMEVRELKRLIKLKELDSG